MKYNEVLRLLYLKENLFLEYEEETKSFFLVDIYDIAPYIDRRDELSVEIDNTTEKINNYSEHDDLLLAAINNSCNRNELDGDLIKIFDISQNIFSIKYRINKMNIEIMNKLRAEKDNLLNNIKSINNNQSAKASKFLNSTVDGSRPYAPKKIKSV